jgi:uncharacterized phiE125 gp8 family phage protein
MVAMTWPAGEAMPVSMPALKLITAADPIVTWGEVAAHLRIDDETERALVESYVEAATQHLDAEYGILAGGTLGVQTYELYLDAFPCGPILIPLSPLVDVVSVTYVDADGLAQSVSAADYVVDNVSRDGWVVPVAGYAWPATLSAINVVTVQFRVGNALIPAPLRHAVLLLTGHLFENREAVTPTTLSEIPIGVYNLVAPYRRIYL